MNILKTLKHHYMVYKCKKEIKRIAKEVVEKNEDSYDQSFFTKRFNTKQ
jgi:hypothetical protein